MTGDPPLNMDEVTVVPACAFRIPGALALRKRVLPFYETDGHLLVACADPHDDGALRAVERHSDLPLRAEHADEESLLRAIHATYGRAVRAVPAAPANAPVGEEFVRRVDDLLNAAALREASDIHIEPEENEVRIRLRVHGRLEENQTVSHETFAGLLGRIKVLARLDIAEKRLPQDGQIHYTTPGTGRRFTLRVATLPAKFGERVTLRVLGLHASSLTLESLGMGAADLATFSDALSRPNGMILITGPTGSGKTSTMYAALRHLLAREAAAPPNIITIEDPVEYDLPGVTQIEVDDQRLTHARALRSVLRHDPDVILVGEIRDRETADIALRAAMTGHLVISTLHTRSAPAAVTRLLDLGVDPYLIAATVHLALAQRLVRKLCRHCRQPAPLTPREAFALGDPALTAQSAWQSTGCKYCAGRGHTGRLAVFEFFAIDRPAANLIASGATEAAFLDLQRERGETTLRSDGIAKLLAGTAAAADVARVLSLPAEGG